MHFACLDHKHVYLGIQKYHLMWRDIQEWRYFVPVVGPSTLGRVAPRQPYLNLIGD